VVDSIIVTESLIQLATKMLPFELSIAIPCAPTAASTVPIKLFVVPSITITSPAESDVVA
jgi:hypothetical protein